MKGISDPYGPADRVDKVFDGLHGVDITETVIKRKPEITISGIDSFRAVPHHPGMLDADEIREELIRQLDAKRIKGADVARHLSIAPARVTEMRNRERKVQQVEMRPLAELLGMVASNSTATERIEEVAQIPHLGEVAQGVWMEQSLLDPDHALRDAFRAKYGEPCKTATQEWQSRIGVKITGETLVWCFATGKLVLNEVGTHIDKSSFIYEDDWQPPKAPPKVDF